MENYTISPDGRYITATYQYDDKKVTIKKPTANYYPRITTTECENGDVFVKHTGKNGFEITKQKNDNNMWEVICIRHRECKQPLYEKFPPKKPHIKAQGPIITEETLKLYEKLPSVLKKLCAPSINLLIEKAQNAITTEESVCDTDKGLIVKESNGRVIRISHKDVIPPLYEGVPKNSLGNKSHGIVLCDETIEIYARLSKNLKEACKPGIDYLIEQARKALMTRKI